MNRQDAKTAKGLMEPPARADEIARKVIGAAIEVHERLGPGFLESVYEEALAVELELHQIAFARQRAFANTYKGRKVGHSQPAFFVEDERIVEVKAVDTLLPIHTSQFISYLRVTERPLGLLINIKVPVLKQGIRRVVLSQPWEKDLGVHGALAV